MKFGVPAVFKHKKFQTGIVTTLMLLLGIVAPAMVDHPTIWAALSAITSSEWLVIISPILTAIGFQGVADIGKEAAKVKNGNGRQTTWDGPDKAVKKKD